MEARKAHRFVAINCEEIAKKVLRLTGDPEEQIEARLRSITQQVVAYSQAQKEKASSLKPKGVVPQ